MKVIVQQIGRKMFLRERNEWTAARSEAVELATALAAIGFCISNRLREVVLVGRNEAGGDVYLYPFGGDPKIKAELKKLRRSVRESKRLKAERQMIRARLDILLAEAKETKKQFPFKRQQVGTGDGTA